MPSVNIPSMAEIKKRLAEQKAKKTSFKLSVSKDFFPFWNMADGEEAVVRLLPDINPDNLFPYYRDKLDHKLSIDGHDKTIVCPKTFDQTADCPICERSQRYYRENNKERGAYYWRNKNSMVRLLIMKSPLKVNDENGEPLDYVGRVCTSQFGYQLMQAIDNQLASFTDDELPPWSLDGGYDLTIKKTPQSSGYATYAYSSFAKRPTTIPKELLDTIEFIDFRDLLPENPGLEKVQHYLDAHDGVVEFQYGKQSDDDSHQSSSSSSSELRSTSPSPSTAPKAKEEAEDSGLRASTLGDSDDSVENAKMLKDILSRRKKASA